MLIKDAEELWAFIYTIYILWSRWLNRKTWEFLRLFSGAWKDERAWVYLLWIVLSLLLKHGHSPVNKILLQYFLYRYAIIINYDHLGGLFPAQVKGNCSWTCLRNFLLSLLVLNPDFSPHPAHPENHRCIYGQWEWYRCVIIATCKSNLRV